MAVSVGLLVSLQAKPGKQGELADFLRRGRELALGEAETVTWYAFKIDESTFGIFDTFEGEAGRQAHLNGEIAAALGSVADELLAAPPKIQAVEVVASK